MSISDMIVVMEAGVLNQIGKPQEVYDDPVNLFVAKFLGTPPISVFEGRVKGGRLYLGQDCVMDVPGLPDRTVTVGVRPEGFDPDPQGTKTCGLRAVEVMGRDRSVVSTHPAAVSDTIRAIIPSEVEIRAGRESVRFALKPAKLHLFDAETEERIPFEV